MKAIIKNIQDNKEIIKNIEKLNYYNVEQFISDAKQYIKAIKEERMICIIKKVSASGMSRDLKFMSAEQGKDKRFYHRQYICLFTALGYKEVQRTGTFKIHGCGMDMVFNTNYNIIHDLKRLGFISDELCRVLAQKTPNNLQ